MSLVLCSWRSVRSWSAVRPWVRSPRSAHARPEPVDSPLILSLSKDEPLAQDRPVRGRTVSLVVRQDHHERMFGYLVRNRPTSLTRRKDPDAASDRDRPGHGKRRRFAGLTKGASSWIGRSPRPRRSRNRRCWLRCWKRLSGLRRSTSSRGRPGMVCRSSRPETSRKPTSGWRISPPKGSREASAVSGRSCAGSRDPRRRSFSLHQVSTLKAQLSHAGSTFGNRFKAQRSRGNRVLNVET